MNDNEIKYDYTRDDFNAFWIVVNRLLDSGKVDIKLAVNNDNKGEKNE